MNKKFLLIIVTIFILVSCKKEYKTDSEYGAYMFEKYISTLISAKDTLEFTSNIVTNLDENTVKKINEMYVLYELTTADIIESIKNRASIYQRIFSDDEEALCNYLPKDGGYYDVAITYREYNDIKIAQIEYPSFNKISKNSIEIVGIYLNDKWNILTINFFN